MRVSHDPEQWRQPEGITVRLPPHVNRPRLTFEEELRRVMSESINQREEASLREIEFNLLQEIEKIRGD